jgi:16S rRNA (guanine527-N7)-methyltransferase
MSDSAPADAWEQLLASGARQLGLAISPAQFSTYRRHLQLLLEHNPRAGLTAITDPREIAVKHFLDSLTCLLVHDIADGERVADIGSGGGFPGLVLAAARPRATYTLVESVRKRTAFLELAARDLGLHNISVLAARAEQVGRYPAHRDTYDLVVSRAVAPLPVLLEYCLPLARVGGHAILYKGPEAEQELARSDRALETLAGHLAATHSLSLPLGMGERVLIVVDKLAPTPARYPRRAGLPSKRPLL